MALRAVVVGGGIGGVAAGVMVVGIALLTMGVQAVRAAMANPAGSLRTE